MRAVDTRSGMLALLRSERMLPVLMTVPFRVKELTATL